MSEPISPPGKGKWAIHTNLSESALSAALAASGHRLISIKSYLSGSSRVYAATSVENVGVTTNWKAKITKPDLISTLASEKGRLISLDAFIGPDGNTYCAAVWVKNDGRFFNWDIELNPTRLRSILAEGHGKLTCLRAYERTVEIRDPIFGTLLSAQTTIEYAAVWIKDDGVPWDWTPSITGDDLYRLLVDTHKGEFPLVSLDGFPAGGSTAFAAVAWRGASPFGWYWFTGVGEPDLFDRVEGLCCYPMDLCQTDSGTFGVVQYAYPALAHPNAATLLEFGGAGPINAISTDLIQSIGIHPTVKNVSSEVVTLTRAVRIIAGPGGWCWFWPSSFKGDQPGDAFGIGNDIAAGASPATGNFTYNSSQPEQYYISQAEAKTSSNKFQQAFGCVSLAVPGDTPVPPLDVTAPAYVGMQGPLEILLMTDGRRLLDLKGQVVNLSGRDMDINGIFIRLVTPADTTAYHAVIPLDFLLDSDKDGKALAKAKAYVKTNGDDRVSPLPRFKHLIEVPASFTSGTLEVELHVKTEFPDVSTAGTKECFISKQTFPVAEGPILSIGSPVKGKYRWGNGPGAAGWHAHFPFHERYCYDLIKVKIDDNGNQTDHTGDGTKNEDAYCWDDTIFAASAGKVVFVHANEADHAPSSSTPPTTVANMVVVQDGKFFFLYVHLRQNSATVTVGQTVNKGDALGRIGDTGFSSGPHLHFGVYTFTPSDPAHTTGVLTPIAISPASRTATHFVPITVPIDGAVIDS